jgi:hypothetical protein
MMKRIDPNVANLLLGFVAALLVGIFTTPLVGRYETLVAISILAIAISTILVNAQARLTKDIGDRLPPITYLNSRHEFESAAAHLIHSSSRFLVATGGRSRLPSYLNAIESKLQKGDFRYFRILNSLQVTSDLKDHLARIEKKEGAILLCAPSSSLGSLSICDAGVLIALPVPGHGDLRGILIPSSAYATRLFEDYMAGVIAKADAVLTANLAIEE